MNLQDIQDAIRTGHMLAGSHAVSEAAADGLTLNDVWTGMISGSSLVARFQEASHAMSMRMQDMKPLDVEGITCPRCAIGKLSPATVNETLRVGANAVEVTIEANLCGFCGERWFDPPAQAIIDAAIQRLRDGDVAHLTHIGELYRAP